MRQLLDEPNARRELGGIGRTKFYELLANGELRSVKVGRRRLVPANAIVEYVQRLEQRDVPRTSAPAA